MFRAPSLHIARRVRREAIRNDPRRSMYILAVVAVCGITLILQIFWTAQNKHRFAPFAIERIICEHCRGLGVRARRNEKGIQQLLLCPACYGVGARQIRRIDEDDVLCPACVGFGRVEEEEGSWRWCARCDGRGLIRREGAPPPVYMAPIPRFGPRQTNAEADEVSAEDSTSSAESNSDN